jgi:hypothetical protein
VPVISGAVFLNGIESDAAPSGETAGKIPSTSLRGFFVSGFNT